MLNIAAAGSVVLTERLDRFVMGGKTVELPVAGVFEVSDGKITAWRDYFDMATWTRQTSGCVGTRSGLGGRVGTFVGVTSAAGEAYLTAQECSRSVKTL